MSEEIENGEEPTVPAPGTNSPRTVSGNYSGGQLEGPVAETLTEAYTLGFLGQVPDETPNESYTVKGVTS